MGDAAAAILNRGPSILLARRPRVTDSRNDTTATAESQDGYTMAVSFWVAHPPQLSLFSIHATDKHARRCYFSDLPRVVGADGPFVLLRATFDDSVTREYFLYKAAATPSLKRIPSPSPEDDVCGRGVRELGILGVHGGGGHYLLAALRDAPSSDDDDGYQLRIYSSETSSWSTRTLRNPCPGVDRVIPDKVIALGGQDQALLGWVDLSHGVLVCNLLLLLQHQDDQDPPVGAVSFVPLPEPLTGNRYKLKYPIPPTRKMRKHPMADELYRSTSWFRDLTFIDGMLKFIEMENTVPPESKDNIIYNSDLIMSLKRKAVDGNSKQQLSAFSDAWRAVTWTQKLASSASASNFWRQTSAAHVADIKGQQLAIRELYSAFPILSPEEDGDDILYLRSLLEPSDRVGSVVAVDIGNKLLKGTARYYLPDDFYYNHPYDTEHPFLTCTLSRHLDMTNPGIQVSACHKITEASSSSPRETSVKPRATIQSLSELARKLKRARNPPESIIENPHISQVHPVENNLPQQHKWDAPPGHSLWPDQNNLPPQQCFNKPDGPCGPGYASLAPHHNYHQNISRLLVASLNLMRHPSHATTVTLEPATMGIHNNFLPLTYLPMAHTQAMTTTDSSFPLLWSCLLVQLGSLHLLGCSVSQNLGRLRSIRLVDYMS